MASNIRLSEGDKVLLGSTLLTVTKEFADSLHSGDTILGVSATEQLRRIPQAVQLLVTNAVSEAQQAFHLLQGILIEQVNNFFDHASELLEDDTVFSFIAKANMDDVQAAAARGRSTTRLELSSKMRSDMIASFRMWRDAEMSPSELVDSISHVGWEVQQWKAPLGVIGFVFEGRPNVFADATGVLKGGNTVVFRIGSDALGTAKTIMEHVIRPALRKSGLPDHCVELLESVEHAAGWALFADKRISLAVARGSGQAVAELGSIAQQSGVPASLHGTGGAWIIAGEQAEVDRFASVVKHSLDRKVCNTANVICIPGSRAKELIPIAFDAGNIAASFRGTACRVHAVNGAADYLPDSMEIDVHRAEGVVREQQITNSQLENLSFEFEWEENPEFFVVVVENIREATQLFNKYSPQFVVSVVSESSEEKELVWRECNAPFVGDGFTRWVDGQFALLRPELGLSNWQSGRLFARGGVLSGDSAFTVRLRVVQHDAELHR